ncbi:MAG: alanine racemase [Bacillota bacterium]|nr:MAG: alanine racemase [Bacillota bacterium]
MILDYRHSASEWEACHRPTWAEISLDAIAENTGRLRALAEPADLMAVVKADAYGHGAVEVSRACVKAGASWLGVAAVEEAVELRRAGITAPILILSQSTPAQAETLAAYDLTAAVFEPETARALAAQGRRRGRPIRAHLKVDTGMGRIGVTPDEAGVEMALRLAALEGLELEGVYTHYATSDEADRTFSDHQTALFDRFLGLAARAGLSFGWRHAANSAAVMQFPETRYNLIRVGISLYGLYPSADVAMRVPLLPAMTWKTRLVHVKTVPAGTPVSYGREFVAGRPTRVGTVPVGYADGYRRCMSSGGRVLVRQAYCPVLGRVNMDHFMIGLDDAPGAGVGDEVVLMGCQPGPGASVGTMPCVPAEELARTCGTINYEIVSTVGRRVPRVFLRDGRPVILRSVLGTVSLGGDHA